MSVLNPDELVFDIECYMLYNFIKYGMQQNKSCFKPGDWEYKCHGLTADEMFKLDGFGASNSWMTQRKYLSRWDKE